MNRLTKDQRGVVLITILIVGMIITFIGLSLVDLTITQYKQTADNVYHSNAMLSAEAGIERTLYQLNLDNSFTGYGTENNFFNNADQGHGTYQTAITAGTSQNEKVITSTGRVYRQSTGDLMSTRKVKVTIVGTKSEGFAVHSGVGGLILGGSSSITNTDVYVNGTVTLNGSSKIGTYNSPVLLNVAHQSCPTGINPGATFPQICTSGQPISASKTAAIYGSVCATNQTSTNVSGNVDGNIFPGATGQGLIVGCESPPNPLPPYDRVGHINDMTTTGTATSNSYVCASGGSKNRTWPANLKLVGDVVIDGSCVVTLTGNVYITGTLTMKGQSSMKVANSVGENAPVVLVDGNIDIGGTGSLLANNVGTGIHFISFKSTADCSPACTNLTGNELYNSMAVETVHVTGSTNFPGMLFHSYWGKVTIVGSGNMGSAIGQTVDLSGSGTIIFGTTLSSGTSTWAIRSYQQIF